jgi:hypothetical protein
VDVVLVVIIVKESTDVKRADIGYGGMKWNYKNRKKNRIWKKDGEEYKGERKTGYLIMRLRNWRNRKTKVK